MNTLPGYTMISYNVPVNKGPYALSNPACTFIFKQEEDCKFGEKINECINIHESFFTHWKRICVRTSTTTEVRQPCFISINHWERNCIH